MREQRMMRSIDRPALDLFARAQRQDGKDDSALPRVVRLSLSLNSLIDKTFSTDPYPCPCSTAFHRIISEEELGEWRKAMSCCWTEERERERLLTRNHTCTHVYLVTTDVHSHM